MEDANQGNRKLSANSLPEVGEDAASSAGATSPPAAVVVPSLTPEEQEELQEELAKVEDEIQTLSHVLAAKEKELAEIKRKLGITPLNELKQNFTAAGRSYRKTSESITLAGQRASAAFTNMGTAITRKLEDVKNKPSFKTFEERVGTLKTKMSTAGTLGSNGSQDGGTSPDPEPLFSHSNEMPNQEPPTH
ncbi:hypothetical protein CRUP_037893 [Coryphaenoides rupestris]|nr:hypothetical protein CRUP_037893 [Coryphaenoides rupestris]